MLIFVITQYILHMKMVVSLCEAVLGSFSSRYNCNRYNEDEAKKARDAQEVSLLFPVLSFWVLGIIMNMCLHSV